MVTSSVWRTWLHIFGDSLGLMDVFKCSMKTSSVWGKIATCFLGLLGMDGCIQMFGGVRTWLLLFVFPLFAYHIQFHLMRFALLNISPLVGKVVRFVLLNISPLVDSVVRFVLLNISPLVGSVVRFVLLIFYIGLVQQWDLFCILNLCDIVQLFCILNLYDIVQLF